MPKLQNQKIALILNNIRSSENVGSIFRTADGAGVNKIYLCGYTPAPLDRFGRENKKLSKVSLGAEKHMEWEKVENLKEAVEKLRNLFPSLANVGTSVSDKPRSKKDFEVIGVEQNKKAVDYRKLKNEYGIRNKEIAFVFGNEVDGLSEEDLTLCDLVVEIPMKGSKESLNVAVSVGIVLYNLLE
ncbi:MAG: TrmH family RNA methyltransferase [Patescibacteria group bacterium]